MLSPDFQHDIDRSLAVLQAEGLILYPTDTIWGIGCDATNAAAVSKVYALKQREETKSLIVLMADEKDILKYTSQPDLRIFDYLHSVSRPTTVIYEGAVGLAANLIGGDGTVAIRLVDDPFCRHLIKRLRRPLVSTSANISGEPAPAFFSAVDGRVRQGVDYIVQHRQDDRTPKQPSSIVRWNRDATVTVIR
jgi:L-threonylcarbamoyladenylate synthase